MGSSGLTRFWSTHLAIESAQMARTPGNVKAAFDSLRPATASSGIGGIIEDDKFSMRETMYAGAGSPIKTE